MRVLKTIFGFLTDPFRKIIALINMDKLSRFFTKRLYLVYLVTILATVLMAVYFYVLKK